MDSDFFLKNFFISNSHTHSSSKLESEPKNNYPLVLELELSI